MCNLTCRQVAKIALVTCVCALVFRRLRIVPERTVYSSADGVRWKIQVFSSPTLSGQILAENVLRNARRAIDNTDDDDDDRYVCVDVD